MTQDVIDAMETRGGGFKSPNTHGISSCDPFPGCLDKVTQRTEKGQMTENMIPPVGESTPESTKNLHKVCVDVFVQENLLLCICASEAFSTYRG